MQVSLPVFTESQQRCFELASLSLDTDFSACFAVYENHLGIRGFATIPDFDSAGGLAALKPKDLAMVSEQ